MYHVSYKHSMGMIFLFANPHEEPVITTLLSYICEVNAIVLVCLMQVWNLNLPRMTYFGLPIVKWLNIMSIYWYIKVLYKKGLIGRVGCRSHPSIQYRNIYRDQAKSCSRWVHVILKHIEAETKLPPFGRRHFQMNFSERKCMNFA